MIVVSVINILTIYYDNINFAIFTSRVNCSSVSQPELMIP